MSSYRLTGRADRDLIEIYLYTLERFGSVQAERYTRNIRRCFEILGENPRMGRTVDSVHRGLRRHEHDRHVIFYREDDRGILIMTIIHRMMNPEIVVDI